MLWICAAHSRKIQQNKGGKTLEHKGHMTYLIRIWHLKSFPALLCCALLGLGLHV